MGGGAGVIGKIIVSSLVEVLTNALRLIYRVEHVSRPMRMRMGVGRMGGVVRKLHSKSVAPSSARIFVPCWVPAISVGHSIHQFL